MSNPYIGEIRPLGFNFAPYGWAFCNGQPMAIAQNDALYAVIGTTYGGDGQTSFNMPDLRGRAAVHQGQGLGLSPYVVGQAAGTNDVTLMTTQLPSHNHFVNSAQTTVATQRSTTAGPNFIPGPSSPANGFAVSGVANNPFSPRAIATAGSGQPHNNIQPLLTVNFCISLYGVYPSKG